jgi:MPBQ/MSBQ methyltransferase
MSKSKAIKISKEIRYQNAALNYYLGLTNSPYLHYGYWDPLPNSKEELTLTRLRAAQQAYCAKLLELIPRGTQTILDVGCGIGGNATALLDQGFAVEGLAPDPFQQERFLQNTQGRAIFHLTQFETFKGTHRYDLILLSESSQYMAADDIARCAMSLLEPGGYLLLADMLRSDASYHEGIFSNCHSVSGLLEALEKAGFSLIQAEDISNHIAPTIDLCVENFHTFGISTFSYLSDLVSIAVPPIHKLLSWAYRRWLHKLVSEGLNSREIFDQHLCYQIQLWQLTKAH